MSTQTRDTIALFAIGLVAMLAVLLADADLGSIFAMLLAKI